MRFVTPTSKPLTRRSRILLFCGVGVTASMAGTILWPGNRLGVRNSSRLPSSQTEEVSSAPQRAGHAQSAAAKRAEETLPRQSPSSPILPSGTPAGSDLAHPPADAIAKSDWTRGNDLMRQAAEVVMGEATLDEELRWVEQLPDGPMKGAAAGRVIEDWGSKNAITPLQWALGIEDPGTRGPALSAAFRKWGAGQGGAEPELGGEMILNLEDERDQDFALNGYVSGLAGSNPDLALSLAETIPSPGLRKAAVERVHRIASDRLDRERAPPTGDPTSPSAGP